MSVFPARYKVQLSRYVETVNDMGDPTVGHLEPVEVLVVGWAVTGGVERGEDGHINQVSWDVSLYAPASLQVDAQDQFIVPGLGMFEVAGSPANWDNGPWWSPGVSEIHLRRVDGQN